MKAGKWTKVVSVVLGAAMIGGALGLTACAGDGEKGDFTIKFVDGTDPTRVLSTVKVDEGKTITLPETPTKEGLQFVDWFVTPNFARRFSATQTFTEDTTIYAGFAEYQNDTRDYYLLGNGTAELTYASNWGKVITDNFKMTKSASTTENVYTFTCDLAEGDELVFGAPNWEYKHGFGYISTGAEYFTSSAGLGDAGRLANIKVTQSGNYTFTMKTYPKYLTAGDMAATDPNYVFNVYSFFDKIEAVRNGDMIVEPISTITKLYVKGSGISSVGNLATWQDQVDSYHTMTTLGDTSTLSIFLKEGEQFMFASQVLNIATDETSAGTIYIKADNLADDVTTKAALEGAGAGGLGGNLKAKKTGLYTFTYKGEKLSCTVDETATLKGTDLDMYFFTGSGSSWAIDTSKKFEWDADKGIYTLKGVDLEAGTQFYLEGVTKGTEAPEHNSNNFTVKAGGLIASSFAEAAGDNVKIASTDNYTITVDPYSKMIMVYSETATPEAFLNAAFKGWSPIAMTYNEGSDSYSLDVTITEEEFAKGADYGIKVNYGGTNVQKVYQTPDDSAKITAAGDYTFTVTKDAAGKYVIAVTPKTAA